MITTKDIIKPVPKFKEIDSAYVRKYFDDMNTHRDAEFFIRVKRHEKFGQIYGGCILYECHATLLNCNQCLFRFKCFTEGKYFILEAEEDAGLIYIRNTWGWNPKNLMVFGCGGATVIEKEGFNCANCDEAVGFCQHEAEDYMHHPW